jgi:hypothetical protein
MVVSKELKFAEKNKKKNKKIKEENEEIEEKKFYLSNPNNCNYVDFFVSTKTLIGLDLLKVFGFPEIKDIYKTNLDDIEKNFDDNGKRINKRFNKKTSIFSSLFSSTKNKKNEKSTFLSYLTCPVIMIIVLIFFFSILSYMKLNEENFFYTQHYEEIDYYKILGVDRNVNENKLKKIYHKLTLKYHPDRNPNCKECPKMISEINEAYIVLKNAELRAFHDKTGVKIPENLMKKINSKKNK